MSQTPTTKKVLIIEDNDSKSSAMRSSLAAGCQSANIKVEIDVTAYLNRALRRVTRNQYDLISTDMQYPALMGGQILIDSGMQFISTAIHEDVTCPIVLCTSAYKQEVELIRAHHKVEAGKFTYVSKDHPNEWLRIMMSHLT